MNKTVFRLRSTARASVYSGFGAGEHAWLEQVADDYQAMIKALLKISVIDDTTEIEFADTGLSKCGLLAKKTLKELKGSKGFMEEEPKDDI